MLLTKSAEIEWERVWKAQFKFIGTDNFGKINV